MTWNRCLPINEWPLKDQNIWTNAFRTNFDLLADRPNIRWRTQTIKTVAKGRYLGWLLHEHKRLLPESVDGRCTSDQLCRYIIHLQSYARPATVRHRIVGLDRALSVVAPEMDRHFLRQAITALPKGGVINRKRACLQDTASLVKLGKTLMKQAETAEYKNLSKQAIAYRNGLQIALLALRPLRIKNFSSIKLERHLVKRSEDWWILFTGDETKTHNSIELPFPRELVEDLEEYLRWYRPLLAGGRYIGKELWLSRANRPQFEGTIRQNICRLTLQEFGVAISPHRFRDCAATSLAIHNPDEVRIAQVLLGHRNIETTEQYYNLAQGLEAARVYGRLLDGLRQKST